MSHQELPFRDDHSRTEASGRATAPPKPPLSMPVFIGGILLGEMLLVGVIMLLVYLGVPMLGWIIAGIAVASVLLILRLVVHLIWNRMMQAWPRRDDGHNVQWRRFQSFRVGMMNLGFSVHVGKDAEHMHLRLIAPMRWFGAVDASVPWAALETRGDRGHRVRLGDVDVWGPTWAFEPPAT